MGSSAEHKTLIRATEQQLAILGYKAWPQNTGAAFRDGQLLKYGKKGGGDLILVLAPYGRHAEGEGKTGNAVQSNDQKRHQSMIEKQGGLYFVFHTPQELIDQLISVGYPPPIG